MKVLNSILISFLLLSIASNNSFADELDGKSISPATNFALSQAIVEVDENSIFAWKAELEGDEIEVKILNTNDIRLTYGCHVHGNSIDCHQEGIKEGKNDYDIDDEMTLNTIKSVNNQALQKLSKTLKRQGASLAAMTAVKVWVGSHGSGDHDHGADIWTKVNYNLKGEARKVFIQCHQHGSDSKFSCHYAFVGKNEPNLSDL